VNDSASIEREISKSYVDLRSVNVGTQFISEHDILPGKKYPIIIGYRNDDDHDEQSRGTLHSSGVLGGLAKLYNKFGAGASDTVWVSFEGGTFIVRVNKAAGESVTQDDANVESGKGGASDSPSSPGETEYASQSVFNRLSLKHLHIEVYEPGNLGKWTPQTEADVYLVFGAVLELTDFRYCCGASKRLLDSLGYEITPKPDAILIDRSTDEYLIAEMKMRSSDYATNHKADDVDVLVCWHDDCDEDRRRVLPRRVLALQPLIETAISQGLISLADTNS